jgi:uncharacterized iron-regulated membrane protein
MGFLRRPQSTWVRRALFQVHVWAGVALAAYVCVIGITGAALVFRPEMQKATFKEYFVVDRPAGAADVSTDTLISGLQSSYPLYRLSGIDYPTARRGTYLSYLIKGRQFVSVFSDPLTGDVIGELPRTSWITRLQDLHFDLFAGSRGRTVNGIGAFSLIVMFATGLIIWWPGIARWKRALVVDVRKPWARINWELHGAAGVWLLALLMLWAVTGVEFAFRRQFRSAVNAVLPLTVPTIPESTPRAGATLGTGDLPRLVSEAKNMVPGAKMGRIVMPSTRKAPILLLMAYKDHGDFDTNDEVNLYFDQYSGRLIERRDTGLEKMSAGDLLMKWMGPIHLGSFGGVGVKVLWSVLALSFPLLAITGTIIWWRRVVRAAAVVGILLVFTTPMRAADRVSDMYLKQVDLVEHDLLSLAQAMPAEQYAFRPAGATFGDVRTFGEQVKHAATMIFMTSAIVLEEKSPYGPGTNDNGPDEVQGKDHIVDYLERSLTYARRAMSSLTEANHLDPLKTYFGLQSRIEVASGVAYHSFNHYGQMVVYARLCGIIPPSSQR